MTYNALVKQTSACMDHVHHASSLNMLGINGVLSLRTYDESGITMLNHSAWEKLSLRALQAGRMLTLIGCLRALARSVMQVSKSTATGFVLQK